jgi:hypothetical protein
MIMMRMSSTMKSSMNGAFIRPPAGQSRAEGALLLLDAGELTTKD